MEASQIWLRWAPESEKVMTVRGWRIDPIRTSGSWGETVDEDLLEVGVEGQVDHHVGRGDAPARASSPGVRWAAGGRS